MKLKSDEQLSHFAFNFNLRRYATIESGDGTCKTGSGTNNAGLWLFTREAVATEETVAALRAVAAAKGFDLSVLRPVTQAGCTYPDEL